MYLSFSDSFSSKRTNSADLEIQTCFLDLFWSEFRFLNFTVPSYLACILSSSEDLEAAPPIWKVLIVSWVPGSPIDWAATIPTASPGSTRFPLPKSLP